MQVEIERAHALRPVDHEQRAMPVRQFAQRGQISPHARCVPHPIESQDARARSERPGDVVRVNITVARRKHRDPHAPPAQVKPREQIGWEVGARDHDLVARLEVEPGGRNADTLRGAVRQRDLLGVGSIQPRQPGAHALRQVEVIALAQTVRTKLQIAGLMNARDRCARERALVGAVQVDAGRKVRKVPPVILRRPAGIEGCHASS